LNSSRAKPQRRELRHASKNQIRMSKACAIGATRRLWGALTRFRLGGAGSQALVECFHPARDPIWWQLVSNRLPLVDCTIQLSEAPGLGWELDQEFVEVRVRA
jgi:hypothetical protein